MCSFLLCCASQAACCAGQCCCSLMCKACEDCGVSKNNFAKLGYLVFHLCWISVAILLMIFGKNLVDYLPSSLQCPGDEGGSSCLSASLVFRMSFSLVLFQIVVFFMTLGRNTPASVFHDGCWAFKSILVGAILFGSLYLPNDFFLKYG